jgi:hypothetical protein
MSDEIKTGWRSLRTGVGSAPAAEATPAQIEEAKQYVVSKGYSYAVATTIVEQYGALRILADKGSAPGTKDFQTESPAEFIGDLVPGRITVRVFDYDTRKSLHIMEQRDAGTEFDVYVRTR